MDKYGQIKTWNDFLMALDGLIEETIRIDMEELKSSEYKVLKHMVKDERYFPNRGYDNISELI